MSHAALAHALLASLPLVLVAATVLTVHWLSRTVLLLAWAAAALVGAKAAARLFRLMLAARNGDGEAQRALRGVDFSLPSLG